MVGVDGSPESRGALQLASQLARAATAKLVAVYALPDLWLASNLETAVVLPTVYETLVRDGRAAIRAFIRDALPAASQLSLEVRTGPAALAIAAVARGRRAGLVVLGGKHHAALARGLGRSTAHYLARTLDTPLLIASQSTQAVTRVLAAVDLSPAAAPTIQAAAALATTLGAQLRVVHVVEPLRVLYLPIAPLDQEGFERLSRAAFDLLLQAFPQVGPDDRVVRTGIATETLAEEAAMWGANVLVVGSHGKGWVDRLLVGSTTERLLNVLPASLLVIPTGRLAQGRQTRRARPAAKRELAR